MCLIPFAPYLGDVVSDQLYPVRVRFLIPLRTPVKPTAIPLQVGYQVGVGRLISLRGIVSSLRINRFG